MIAAFDAILPVMLLIGLGSLLKRNRLLPVEFFSSAELFSYYIAFPTLLLSNIMGLSLPFDTLLGVGGSTIAAILCILAVTIPIALWSVKDLAAFTSVLQGAIRPNTYLGLALSAALLNQQGFGLIILCMAVSLPLVNFISVLALSLCSAEGRANPSRLARSILTNPIILACAAGLALNLLGLHRFPAPLDNAIAMLAKTAMPLGLIVVGGGLVGTKQRLQLLGIVIATIMKMIALPFATWAAGTVIGLEPPLLAATIFFAALPTAPNAYVLAKVMGGDAALMSSIILSQTAISFLSLPFTAAFLPELPTSQ